MVGTTVDKRVSPHEIQRTIAAPHRQVALVQRARMGQNCCCGNRKERKTKNRKSFSPSSYTALECTMGHNLELCVSSKGKVSYLKSLLKFLILILKYSSKFTWWPLFFDAKFVEIPVRFTMSQLFRSMVKPLCRTLCIFIHLKNMQIEAAKKKINWNQPKFRNW